MLIKGKRERMDFLQREGELYALDELAALFGCTRQRAHQLLQDAGVKMLTLNQALRRLRALGR